MPSPRQATRQPTSAPVDDFADIAQAHPAAVQDDFADIVQGGAPANSGPQPLARTPGNYISEVASGVGRGLKNDVVGAVQTVLHPINTVTSLYQQGKDAIAAGRKEYNELDKNVPAGQRVAAATAEALKKAPVVGGMVSHIDQGDGGYGSPESFGAAAEAGATFLAPEMLGKGVKGVATSKMVSESIPTGMINSLIKPAVADVKFGKNPARAILREGITGNSLAAMGDKVFGRAREIGKQMDLKANDPLVASKIVDVSDALKPIDQAMADATKAGNTKLYDNLVDFKHEITQDWKQFKPAQGKMIIRPKGLKNLKMSPAEALEFKRQIGDRIRWDGTNPFNNEMNAVKGEVYGALKDKVNDAVPELRDLNERYSDLVGAGKAIERREVTAGRNHGWSLSDIALGASGHGALAVGRKMFRTPAVSTRVAKGLYGLGH